MLMSLDGKISTGDNDLLDFDADLPKLKGIGDGLKQYYQLEQKTDLHSLNTGRVMEKIGINRRKDNPEKTPVSFIIIDNKPHLNKNGIRYLSKKLKKLYIVTTNAKHPADSLNLCNVEIIHLKKLNLSGLLRNLKSKYKIDKLTIQSGGTLNSAFIRESLIDHVSVVVAPCLVGGKDTSTLVDGESLHSAGELKKIRCLKLRSCMALKGSYLHLKYDVIN